MATTLNTVLSILLFMPTLALAFHSYGPPLPTAAANTLVSNFILNLAIGSYMLAFGLYLLTLSHKEVFGTVGWYFTYIAVAFHASGYLYRWKELYLHGQGRFPLSTFYEALIFYCLLLAFMGIAIQLRSNKKNIMAFFLPIIVIVLLFANYTEFSGIRTLYESNSYENKDFVIRYHRLKAAELALSSIAFCLLSTAGISSVMLKVLNGISQKSSFNSSNLLSESTLYELNKITTLGGFAILCLGTLFGAYISKIAWGIYWGWFTSETLRAFLIVIYAYVILKNTIQGWLSIKAANRSIIGIGFIIFLYLFVSSFLQEI